ncbi:DNA helicase-2/ATP-dependent DNA helicase PcrA [Planomicrobium sp. HSC-17F08]|nr:DNA helicase-2/ATP-dependent DNA helicase PcrA [Planomicrobium sp. HSC-17F08]
MYIPTALNDAPGLKAEINVWKAITSAFNEEETLAIHHYPMFFANGLGRREIDILLINTLLGVCVIEVKGINITQIKEIRGHQWIYTDFYEEQSSPFEQAENQLQMLCKHLELDPVLYRRFSKRVFIALPYITEEQWIERGFHKQINVPMPLFKEDLESTSKLLSKLKSFALSNVKNELKKFELKKISHALGVRSSDNEQVTVETRQPFSILYVVHTNKEFESYLQEINTSLENGTKIFLLTYIKLEMSKINDSYKYLQSFQLNLYISNGSNLAKIPPGKFVDGAGMNKALLELLANQFSKFNTGQYKAIHNPVFSHQIITAGAGTGKTYVMIDRILFLLLHGGIPLNKIVMITFTNASTNEMKKRLEERFLALFKLTGKSKFLLFAEEVKDMQISTIHSFARSILKQLAHEIGYGRNVQLRSFKYEKKKIINELLDEFYSTRPIEEFLKIKIKDYEFTELVYGMWEEMEKKGLTFGEIEQIDWGTVVEKEAITLQETFKYIFMHCEARLDILKNKENAVTMGDLIRKLKLFTTSGEKMKQLTKDHFIFVDEFQDSDVMQIELLAGLQRYLNYQLFVVGDIKQAIYRFRGADYKSFQELQDLTDEIKYEQTSLQLNYRSSASLLNKMHLLFQEWNKCKWLNYEETDKLLSNENTQFPNNDLHFSFDYKKELDEALKTLPSKKEKIAFIVRTNRQAKTIKEYCISKKIPTSENLDGTFFISTPVLHFKALIEGLLFPSEPKFLLNALQTPYFGYKIPYQTIVPFGGHKELINAYINKRTNNGLKQYVSLMRTLAPMTVIQKIIFENQLYARLPDFLKTKLAEENKGLVPSDEEVNIALLRYEKNLQHLMVLIERNFSSQNVTLQKLRDWLQLQINTNRNENEPMLEENAAQVVITTVHRSKGLEYHTVFLPITNSSFNALEEEYFLEEASEKAESTLQRKFGWRINLNSPPNYPVYQNSYFQLLKEREDQEKIKEETRLLYVALTRAKQRLYITMPKKRKDSIESWASILEKGGLFNRKEVF